MRNLARELREAHTTCGARPAVSPYRVLNRESLFPLTTVVIFRYTKNDCYYYYYYDEKEVCIQYRVTI